MKIFELIFWPITMPIKFIQQNFKATLFVTIIIFVVINGVKEVKQKANIGVIKLEGAILSADNILEKIEKYKKDKNIKGVLFEINSPGGAVAPSVEISYSIKELNKIKPVIAYSSGMLTSGAYYSAIWAKKIVANPGSMVGSIGVIIQGADISTLLNKIGIKPQIAKAGKYKEAGTFTRSWSKDEKDELDRLIKNTYNMFVADVATARKLDINNSDNFANAHIFSAFEAKKLNLIDEVNIKSYAINLLKKEAKLDNIIFDKTKERFKILQELKNKVDIGIKSYFGLFAILN